MDDQSDMGTLEEGQLRIVNLTFVYKSAFPRKACGADTVNGFCQRSMTFCKLKNLLLQRKTRTFSTRNSAKSDMAPDACKKGWKKKKKNSHVRLARHISDEPREIAKVENGHEPVSDSTPSAGTDRHRQGKRSEKSVPVSTI